MVIKLKQHVISKRNQSKSKKNRGIFELKSRENPKFEKTSIYGSPQKRSLLECNTRWKWSLENTRNSVKVKLDASVIK